MLSGLFTIPAGVAFADALARGVVAQSSVARDPLELANVTIYLPTRRAARTLNDAFSRAMSGAALLPDIRALGDIDEEEFTFEPGVEDLEIAPAIDPVRRRLLLATLVQRWATQRRSEAPGLTQSVALARHLARFIDEAHTHNADLERLNNLVPPGLAQHWAEVRDFLLFLREHWPPILAAEGAVDPAARRNTLLQRLARRYRENPPAAPVIAAGTTGSIPATAELLAAIAEMPAGAVVLPALDRDLDAASWDTLAPGHPQFGMKQLLARLGAERSEVRDWPGTSPACAPRVVLLREALRPAPTTDAWRALAERGGDESAKGLDGLGIVNTAHPGEEAVAIALMLREAVETPAKTAALVTPDRALARRVAAELQRWNIVIDDSGGVPLANTPPAVFLSLLIEAAADGFGPVPLLALLKHPFAAAGFRPGEFRRRARELDRHVLRGPRPDPGLGGIAKAIAHCRAEKKETTLAPLLTGLAAWFDELTSVLQPLAIAIEARTADLPEIVQLHAEVAERLATTDAQEGKDRLWHDEAGEAAAGFIEQLARAGAELTSFDVSAYPALFREFAEERSVRPVYGRHPRLAILGPLEARLQHFDLVVLGGLNEGTWPRSAAADPWLSRPMRESLGLEYPEREIGLASHDFATLATCPEVRLTRSLKIDGTPTVASRWLQRLEQLAKGLKLETRLRSANGYANYATLFSTPESMAVPAPRPEPRPPVAKRPRELPVTRIETWLRDPYAIYARYILRLKPLEPLDAELGPLDRGSALHEILERFISDAGDIFADNAVARLIGLSEEVFAEHGIPQSTLALWRARFARAAQWFVDDERRRRPAILRSHLEIGGRIAFDAPAGPFVLTARADRLDELRSGGVAVIDYKTGNPPSDAQVGVLAPQLPLEGAILKRGGFEGIGALTPSQLVYILFSGGDPAGQTHIVKGEAHDLSEETFANLVRLIADFDRVETPYASRIAPFSKTSIGDYDHLARVREWSIAGREQP